MTWLGIMMQIRNEPEWENKSAHEIRVQNARTVIFLHFPQRLSIETGKWTSQTTIKSKWKAKQKKITKKQLLACMCYHAQNKERERESFKIWNQKERVKFWSSKYIHEANINFISQTWCVPFEK